MAALSLAALYAPPCGLPADSDLESVASAAWARLHGPDASALQIDDRLVYAHAQLRLAAAEASAQGALRRIDMALFVAGDDDDARTSGYAHALHASLPYAASFPRDWPFTAPKVPRCYSPLRRGAADPFDYGAPVVLERLADHWPACRTWTPAFFSRVMGHRTVPVEVGAHSNDFALQLMTVNEFLSRHIFQTAPGGATGYLAQHPLSSQVPLLQNDFAIPHVCESAPHVNVWIGPAGTLTPFHADPYRNVLVQIVGCKRVQLKQSQCDAAEDDVVLLGPGEALYIPDGWLHQVASLETSISLSFWWPPPLALPPPPPPRQTTQ